MTKLPTTIQFGVPLPTHWKVTANNAGYKTWELSIGRNFAAVEEENAPHAGFAGGGRCAFAKDKPPESWYAAKVLGYPILPNGNQPIYLSEDAYFKSPEEAIKACEKALVETAQKILKEIQ